ncbi:MAG TPA: DUF2905 domain-containing protein [Candidatus Omnitrophota bacterium]|nr:DUF2905 domain-containing protein [Candidatus Omnitrophota bacterium]
MNDPVFHFSKTLIFFGAAVAGAGVLLLVLGRVPWIGKLPGDFLFRRGNFSFYFPLATCLLISVLLTLIFNLFKRP